MAWKPEKDSLITIEEFNDTNLSGHSAMQSVQDGSVRLIPQYTGRRSFYSNWPNAPVWDISIDFQYSGQATGIFSDSKTGTSATNEFIADEGSWTLISPIDSTAYLGLTTGTQTNSISSMSGNFAIEMALSIEGGSGAQSGTTGAHGMGLYLSNHVNHEYLEFHPSGVHFHYHPELDFNIDLRTRKNLRVGVSGSDLYVFAEPGFGMIGVGKWNTSATFYSGNVGAPVSETGQRILIGTPDTSDVSGDVSGYSGQMQVDSFRYAPPRS